MKSRSPEFGCILLFLFYPKMRIHAITRYGSTFFVMQMRESSKITTLTKACLSRRKLKQTIGSFKTLYMLLFQHNTPGAILWKYCDKILTITLELQVNNNNKKTMMFWIIYIFFYLLIHAKHLIHIEEYSIHIVFASKYLAFFYCRTRVLRSRSLFSHLLEEQHAF